MFIFRFLTYFALSTVARPLACARNTGLPFARGRLLVPPPPPPLFRTLAFRPHVSLRRRFLLPACSPDQNVSAVRAGMTFILFSVSSSAHSEQIPPHKNGELGLVLLKGIWQSRLKNEISDRVNPFFLGLRSQGWNIWASYFSPGLESSLRPPSAFQLTRPPSLYLSTRDWLYLTSAMMWPRNALHSQQA